MNIPLVADMTKRKWICFSEVFILLKTNISKKNIFERNFPFYHFQTPDFALWDN